ncbi:uncharacterized protein NEMAJ01_0873 [Nematocida major]|uniref:uncharacterized protein n=1 Tax=Nematocida major TaxID=1912982 RepID=UPI00200722FF|nr:uncharacterized protein NEMAJ01_0873 [Nematocida major]KAH9385977.1 hypothetical protein NEMAJ01_0873 [Nematocida major]
MLQLSEGRRAYLFDDVYFAARFIVHADSCIHKDYTTALMDYFRQYRKESGNPLFNCKELISYCRLENIFECLFANRNTDNAAALSALILDEVLAERQKKARKLVAMLSLAWFGIVLSRGFAHYHDMLLSVYMLIEPSPAYVASRSDFYYFWDYPDMPYSLVCMEREREALIASGGLDKFKKVHQIFTDIAKYWSQRSRMQQDEMACSDSDCSE